MVLLLFCFLFFVETTNEILKISEEMDACSRDAVNASKSIKHYNTLKVVFNFYVRIFILQVNAEKALELVTAMIDLNRSVAGVRYYDIIQNITCRLNILSKTRNTRRQPNTL